MPALVRRGMALPVVQLPDYHTHCLAKIRSYQSASSAAFKTHVPVPFLERETCVWGGSPRGLDIATSVRPVFQQFATQVMTRWISTQVVHRDSVLQLQAAWRLLWGASHLIPNLGPLGNLSISQVLAVVQVLQQHTANISVAHILDDPLN